MLSSSGRHRQKSAMQYLLVVSLFMLRAYIAIGVLCVAGCITMSPSSQKSFTDYQDDARHIVQACVERVLKSGGVEQAASASQLEQWCERISGDAVSALHEHPPLNGFKIAATAVLVPKRGGGGLNMGSAAVWQANTDGVITVRWETQGLLCCVTVFAMIA